MLSSLYQINQNFRVYLILSSVLAATKILVKLFREKDLNYFSVSYISLLTAHHYTNSKTITNKAALTRAFKQLSTKKLRNIL